LTSRGGVIPLSLTFDTTGALTRTVKDLAIVLDAIAGPDAQDAATRQQPKTRGSYVQALAAQSLREARLGVITNFRGANAEVDARGANRAERTCGSRRRADSCEPAQGIRDPVEIGLGSGGEAEFKPQFERYLHTLAAAQPKTLAQLIR